MGCELTRNLYGIWETAQFFPHSQVIVKKYSEIFEGTLVLDSMELDGALGNQCLRKC